MDGQERELNPEQRRRLENALQWLNPLHTSAFVEACKADLERGHVFIIDGEVIFDAHKIIDVTTNRTYGSHGQRLLAACHEAYSARVPGRGPMALAPGLSLLPGRYRLQVAPRTNLVLGAEELVGSHEYHQQMQRVLLNAQRITEETLRENRRGLMTDAQRQTLRAAPKSYMAFAFAILALICGLSTYTSIAAALRKNQSLWSVNNALGASLTLFFLALLPSALIEQRKRGTYTQADADEGRLEARDGIARKNHTMHRSLISFTVTLGTVEFDVTDKPEVFAAMVEGHTYRAWVAPRSGHLIALEFVEQAAKG